MKKNKKNIQWIHRTHLFRADEYICSVCNYPSAKPFSFCPNCGSSVGRIKYDPSWVDETEDLLVMLDDDW